MARGAPFDDRPWVAWHPRAVEQGRRVPHGHRGRLALVLLGLYEGVLARAALGETGAGNVGGEGVGVAVHAQGTVSLLGQWVEPGSGGQPQDAAPHSGADPRPREHRAAVVEDPYEVTGLDGAGRRVLGMEFDGLAVRDLGAEAERADVVLAVQPGCGLAISSRGWRRASGLPGHSSGSSQAGWPGQSARPRAASVAE